MNVRRRSIVRGMIGAGVVGSGHATGEVVLARSSAPKATPATPDAETPEAIVQRFRETSIVSPLFPRDAGELTIVDWVDDGDTDLVGTVGAFLVQGTGMKEPIGAFMVHPTVESAQARFARQASDGGDDVPLTFFGYSGAWGHYSDGTSIVALVDGLVIVSALGKGPERGPDEPLSDDHREADARSLANLAGMMDSLRLVMAATKAG